eukprot:TRINITY_DN7828_c0_g1_i1.p1 TRINITY_DN7828_c0_g1~~TRINITY_DN7828_c0_g1_i1.p1  ORF type:complete len:406 (+),score=96.76 TRINITY_DN7828_c0_g1_i1:23-1219(+)
MAKKITPIASRSLLEKYVADIRHRFDIEYKGGLSNHFTHTAVSLYNIGASDEQLKDFHDRYQSKTGFGELDPALKSRGKITSENWKEYIGHKDLYPDFVEFFRSQRDKHPTDQNLIDAFYPDLIMGLGGSALHGPIELGWSLQANLPIEEGLAYCAISYVRLEEDAEKHVMEKTEIPNSIALIDIFNLIHNEKQQHNLFKMDVTKGLLNDRLSSLIRLIKGGISDGFDYTNYGARKASMWMIEHQSAEGIQAAIAELNTATMQLFYSTGNKDFFILHLMTGCHAITNIARSMSKHEDIHLLLRSFVLASVYVYVLQGCPQVIGAPKEYTGELNWQQICKKAAASEDEHVPKAVDVCRIQCVEFPQQGHEALCLSVASSVVTDIVDSGSFNFVGVVERH